MSAIQRPPNAIGEATGPPPACIPFDTIDSPGSYVCHWNGFLLRVPSTMLGSSARNPINIVGTEPLFVTRISADPEIPVTQARRLAHQRNLKVSF